MKTQRTKLPSKMMKMGWEHPRGRSVMIWHGQNSVGKVETIAYFTFSQVKLLFGLKKGKTKDKTDMRSHFCPNETQACTPSSYLSPLFNKNTQLDTGKYVTHNSRTTGNLALSTINGLAVVMLKSLCGIPQRINVSHDIIRKSTTLAINALNFKIINFLQLFFDIGQWKLHCGFENYWS